MVVLSETAVHSIYREPLSTFPFAESDLGLHVFPLSVLWDARL